MLRHCPINMAIFKKKSEIGVCETNRKGCLKKGLGFIFLFLLIFYILKIFYIYIPRDGDKVESRLLVPMDFCDKLYRPKLVKLYSVLF